MNRSTKGLLWAAGAMAIPAAVNVVINSRAAKMEQPLPGDIGFYEWVYGQVAFYRLGQGEPLLLVHNPNAGGSSWEWRKIFPELANHYTVYALDLLGFGLSAKPNIPYSGGLYADLVHDFMQDVIGQRSCAVGSSLASSYLVNVAVRRPEIIERLVLVNPTGTTNTLPLPVQSVADGVLDSPIIGTSIYNSLVSMRGIEEELRTHDYYDASFVTPEMVRFYYASAHQSGSQHAAAAFISGKLDLPMRMAFTDLTQPVLMIWGREAFYTPVSDAADLLYRHPQARLAIYDECGMLPHDEKAGDFIRDVRQFFQEVNPGEIAA